MQRRFAAWGLALVLNLSANLAAEIPEPILLYPDGAPGAKGTAATDQPAIRIYPPAENVRTGAAVVICPGGGYGILATDHEGHQVARWFQRNGITGVVLRYRHAPKYRHPIPLEDALAAIRYVRSHADELKLSPQRIGVMGFSAGGHLASTVATHFEHGKQAISARPDFAILGYPVISLMADFAHAGSRRNLLGDAPDEELVRSLSNETQVTENTPPVFIFQTTEDRAVPAENSLAFYMACLKAGVPAELHVYQNGPHGVGLGVGDPVVYTWKDRLLDWLKTNAFLADVTRVPVTGTVNIDGEPLRWGTLTLIPQDNPNAPVAAARISRGKFSLPAKRGAVVGVNRVVIRSLGAVEIDPTIPDVIEYPSGLVFQIQESGNEFKLDLKSQ